MPKNLKSFELIDMFAKNVWKGSKDAYGLTRITNFILKTYLTRTESCRYNLNLLLKGRDHNPNGF